MKTVYHHICHTVSELIYLSDLSYVNIPKSATNRLRMKFILAHLIAGKTWFSIKIGGSVFLRSKFVIHFYNRRIYQIWYDHCVMSPLLRMWSTCLNCQLHWLSIGFIFIEISLKNHNQNIYSYLDESIYILIWMYLYECMRPRYYLTSVKNSCPRSKFQTHLSVRCLF